MAAEAFGTTRGGGQGGAPGQRGGLGVGIAAAGRPAAPLFWQPKEEEGKQWVDLVVKWRKSRGSSVNIKFPVVLGLK